MAKFIGYWLIYVVKPPWMISSTSLRSNKYALGKIHDLTSIDGEMGYNFIIHSL